MSTTGASLRIDLDRAAMRSVLRLLLGLGVLFALVHLVVFVVAPDAGWGPLEDLGDLDDDHSVGSGFSSLQYLGVTVAVLLVARERLHPSALSRRFLLAVGAVALFLSLDEMFRFHERITELAEKLDIGPLKAVMINGHGAWIAVYAVIAVVLLVAGRTDLGLLWQHYRPEMRPALLGVLLLGLGEVGIEVLAYLLFDDGLGGRAYEVLVILEELSAMAGMSLVLYAVLLVLGRSQETGPEPTSGPGPTPA